MQINYITRQPYNGGNDDTLDHEQKKAGYTSNEWLTFLQAKQIGRQVKKGCHGVRLLKVLESQEGEDRRKYVRGFTVFNLDQTEVGQ